MRARWFILPLLAFTAAMFLLACAPSAYKEAHPAVSDRRYDSEFPYRNSSSELEAIGETVKRVSGIAYYRRYTFPPREKMKLAAVNDSVLDARERNSVFFNNSTSGTATVISNKDGRVVLLTCAHVVAFPDTLISYYIDDNQHLTDIVTSIAIKKRQSTFVATLPEGGEVDILVMSREADIALLGRRYINVAPTAVPAFSYPFGKARELEWGSFVYLFGFPSGYKMITKGIVRSPNKDKRGSFLVDATFSRGFSGGIAIAVRDGVPNFELVGIVKLVSARSSFVLAPDKRDDSIEYDPSASYHGEMFVEKKTDIEYGITQAISIESIIEFIQAHQRELNDRGFPMTLLLKQKEGS